MRPLLCLLFVLGCVSAARSAAPASPARYPLRVHMSVDPPIVRVGESIRLTVRITNPNDREVLAPNVAFRKAGDPRFLIEGFVLPQIYRADGTRVLPSAINLISSSTFAEATIRLAPGAAVTGSARLTRYAVTGRPGDYVLCSPGLAHHSLPAYLVANTCALRVLPRDGGPEVRQALGELPKLAFKLTCGARAVRSPVSPVTTFDGDVKSENYLPGETVAALLGGEWRPEGSLGTLIRQGHSVQFDRSGGVLTIRGAGELPPRPVVLDEQSRPLVPFELAAQACGTTNSLGISLMRATGAASSPTRIRQPLRAELSVHEVAASSRDLLRLTVRLTNVSDREVLAPNLRYPGTAGSNFLRHSILQVELLDGSGRRREVPSGCFIGDARTSEPLIVRLAPGESLSATAEIDHYYGYPNGNGPYAIVNPRLRPDLVPEMEGLSVYFVSNTCFVGMKSPQRVRRGETRVRPEEPPSCELRCGRREVRCFTTPARLDDELYLPAHTAAALLGTRWSLSGNRLTLSGGGRELHFHRAGDAMKISGAVEVPEAQVVLDESLRPMVPFRLAARVFGVPDRVDVWLRR